MCFEYHHMDKWAFANLDLIEESLEKQKKAVVLISGASSSGKSYAAKYLAALLESNNHRAVTISLDKYNFGLSGIIPNKVNLNEFHGKLEHIEEISKRIKNVIIDVPFESKFDRPVLPKIQKAVEDLVPEAEMNRFLDALYQEWKVLNFDEPTVYNLKEAAIDVKRLLHDENLLEKDYSKVISERVESNHLLDGSQYDVILIEGIYALDKEMVDNLRDIDTIKDFIDGNPKSLFLRRILRDAKLTSAHNTFTISLYFRYIIKSYMETIYPCRVHADVILNNDMTFSEMRQGDLYLTKDEIKTDSLAFVDHLKRHSEILSVTYQKDTYFTAEGEDPKLNNILRLRSVSLDGGKTYQPTSLVHKGTPKVRKDEKVIRPINVLLNESEFKEVWQSESDCLHDFLYAKFLIGPIQHKVKTRLVYKEQKITIREVEGVGAYIEFTKPILPEVYRYIKRSIHRYETMEK